MNLGIRTDRGDGTTAEVRARIDGVDHRIEIPADVALRMNVTDLEHAVADDLNARGDEITEARKEVAEAEAIVTKARERARQAVEAKARAEAEAQRRKDEEERERARAEEAKHDAEAKAREARAAEAEEHARGPRE